MNKWMDDCILADCMYVNICMCVRACVRVDVGHLNCACSSSYISVEIFGWLNAKVFDQ